MATNNTNNSGNFVKCEWDNVFRHKVVPEVRAAAIKKCSQIMWCDEAAIAHMKETFELVQNKENWKNPCSILCDCKDNAVLFAAAIMYYHAGVEISANSDGTQIGVYSKGYNFYTGEC